MTKKTGNILVVDDNEDLLLAARLFLKQHFSIVHTEQNPENLPLLLNNENYDVILLDMNFTMDATSGVEGFMWLDKILQMDPSAVVILITAFGDVEMAVKAVKAGAIDFVLKPWQNEKLLATISSALNLRYSRLEVDKLRSQQKQLSEDIDQRYHDMIGQSPVMQHVFATIDKVAETDADVLILGENGTGKELVARAIHGASPRRFFPIVAVNCGAIPKDLQESQFFGHEAGSFTDATLIAGQATALGLYLRQMGGFRPETARSLFAIPETHEAVAMFALGYLGAPERLADNHRVQESAPRDRRPLTEFVFTGGWGKVSSIVED